MDKLENQSYNFSNEAGDFVSCNLDRLIDEIYISPKSSEEFVNEVKAVVEKYNLSKKVIQSDLYKDYIY